MDAWIPPEHEAAALRALLLEYHCFNRDLFGGLLRPAALGYADDRGTLGRWLPSTRTILLSRRLVSTAPWLETVEVLKHEMAHQFVGEVLRVEGEPEHGPAFRAVCRDRGIDARASGAPEPARSASSAMRRVEKLLSLGQSAERHEAEAAMRKAQALLRTYNLGRIEAGTEVGYAFRQLGPPLSRIEAVHRWVVSILIDHFFVDAVWVPAFVPGREKMGSVAEIGGTPENLEVAVYVHDFLHGTADRLWRAHRARTGASGHGRRRYLVGVMMGFAEKLGQAVETDASPSERALLRVRDPALRAWMRRRYPRQATMRGSGTVQDAHLRAGQEAGRSIVLRKGVTATGPGGRLLGPGR